jgi:hypothetical protein
MAGGAAPALSSGTLSCVGSTIPSVPGSAQVNVARLLQRNISKHENSQGCAGLKRLVENRTLICVTINHSRFADAATAAGVAKNGAYTTLLQRFPDNLAAPIGAPIRRIYFLIKKPKMIVSAPASAAAYNHRIILSRHKLEEITA